MQQPAHRSTWHAITPLVGVILVIAALAVAREVLIPISLAVLLTFLFTPPVRGIQKLGLNRSFAVMIVATLSLLAVGAIGWVIEGQAMEFVARLPEYKSNIIEKIHGLRDSSSPTLRSAQKTLAELSHEIAKPADAPAAPLPTTSPPTPPIDPSAAASSVPPDPLSAALAPPTVAPASPTPVTIVDPPLTPVSYVRTLIQPLLEPLATTGIVVVFTIFMLIKREDLRDRLIRLIGSRQINTTTQALDEAADRVSRYLLMQSVINAGAGVLIGLGLFALSVPNAGLWGLLAALLRFVPYVGIWIAAALPVAVSIAIFPGWLHPAAALGLFVLVEIVCANVIEPLLYASGTGVAPIAILVAAVFWTWLWGGVGLLLATPLTVCLVVIGRHVPRLGFLEILLGDQPVLPAESRFYQRLLAGDQEEIARIAESVAKESTFAQAADAFLLPAMRMAEQDRHRGDLDERREKFILDILPAIIEDFAQRADPEPNSDLEKLPQAPPQILILPAGDPMDALAGDILARLLQHAGVSAQSYSTDVLSGEQIAAVATLSPVAVCISGLPPESLVHARVLARRLRKRYPALTIVVGLWDAGAAPSAFEESLAPPLVNKVVTTLAQAAAFLTPLANQATVTKAAATAQERIESTSPALPRRDASSPVSVTPLHLPA